MASHREAILLPLEESLDAKRRSATAGALRVRILKLEACRLKRFDIIHYATAQVHQRCRIDENLETVEGEDLVHHSRLVLKGHGILETRTAAAYYANAQSCRKGVLRRHDFANFANCCIRQR